jgi:ABC-type branched-subunit amino acid transport system ATPase component
MATEGLLEAREVSRRFGGVLAVDAASIVVRAGSLHGLIGPNGAGKSTFVNVLTGVDRADRGSVRFAGRDVTGLNARQRARLGIARSFQTSQLFGDETVLTNVMVGRHRLMGYRFPNDTIYTWVTRREERQHAERCEEILEQLGLTSMARSRVSELPYGRRRLVEIARALAADPSLLVLDEPAAGMAGADAERLAVVLTDLVDRKLTVLLIEHNIGLVMSVCDQLTVLAEGRALATGHPHDVRERLEVIEAYLGKGYGTHA